LPRLPTVTGPELVRVLERAGWECVRMRGSHAVMIHRDVSSTVPVPTHAGRDLPLGTLRAILRETGISPEEFSRLVR
jgi:predicted RNA binding protein YcfA (HicA-like mRNA interferase family)